MRLADFQHLECPLARALEIVGEWWTLLIIRDLFYGVRTYDALKADLGISRNMLASRLKKLEENEIVEKHEYQQKPQRFRYVLTQKGRDLFPVILTLTEWGNRWEGNGEIVQLQHLPDGHSMHPVVVCGECRQPVTHQNVRPLPGPGATRPNALPIPLRPVKNV